MSITKFEANTPVRVALKFGAAGKHVTGKYGEQVLYSFTDGSVGYVPVIVEKKLQELAIKPGQAVEICKAKSNGKTEWKVSRVTPETKPEAKPVPTRKPQGAAALLDGAPELDGAYTHDPAIQTQLEFALKTALHAAKQAEEYSRTIGHPVVFDKDDVRLLAQTLVINAKGRAA